MKRYLAIPAVLAALMVSPTYAAKTTHDAHDSQKQAPVAQPDTERNTATSGAVVPGQPIRPESSQEAEVPKTPMDKDAANAPDVGTQRLNNKSQQSGSGQEVVKSKKNPS